MSSQEPIFFMLSIFYICGCSQATIQHIVTKYCDIVALCIVWYYDIVVLLALLELIVVKVVNQKNTLSDDSSGTTLTIHLVIYRKILLNISTVFFF